MEAVNLSAPGPFEGPEKLLEIWFAPTPAHVPNVGSAPPEKLGLRAVERRVWEDMLDIVKCRILSEVKGTEFDAYLLSESSLFVSPHRLILKTCGTTLNLLGVPRILSIAKEYANMPRVYQCFYSRKAFMFPDRQLGPHKDWSKEVELLDRIFEHGSAYTVGKVNGDHWLLYMTGFNSQSSGSGTENGSQVSSLAEDYKNRWAIVSNGGLDTLRLLPPTQDYTIEILMTQLSARACASFFTHDAVDPNGSGDFSLDAHALRLSSDLGISDIFPRKLTQLDAHSFVPCGYSSNALIKWKGSNVECDEEPVNEGYFTIHVTPEEGWSYASFECNIPLAVGKPRGGVDNARDIPDLHTLIQRVVRIFEPGKLTMTLFVSSSSKDGEMSDSSGDGTVIELAQRAFKSALARVPMRPAQIGTMSSDCDGSVDKKYKRTDKINYEFDGYDLAFASFEMI